MRNALWVLWGAVGMVLLIACANLSNLLLVRGVSRRGELAVRGALGAGKGRLVRQLLTESLVLSGLGAILGIGLAWLAVRLIVSSQAVVMPMLERVQLDAVGLGFALLVTVVIGVVVGTAPALQVSRRDPAAAMSLSGRGALGDQAHSWTRSSLVVAEIALACVLLVGAGLLARSFMQILDVELGFRPEHKAMLRVEVGSRYDSTEKIVAFYGQITSAAPAVTGVAAAALTAALPLDSNRTWGIRRVDSDDSPDAFQGAFIRLIGNGYFGTMGVPVLAGREFVTDDTTDSEPVIVVNRTLAETLFPGRSALGQSVLTSGGTRRIVGVVGDVRHNRLDEDAGNEMYLPLPQMRTRSLNMVVRGERDPLALAGQLRTALRDADPLLPFTDFLPLGYLVERAVSPRRFFMAMLVGFAGIALILAALGVYGVISYSVGQRRAEIGVRLALGAMPTAVLLEEIRRGMGMALAGLGVGLVGSFLLARLMASLLYEVGTGDPITYAAMVTTLLAVALLAGYLPARRASRTDPVTALRDA